MRVCGKQRLNSLMPESNFDGILEQNKRKCVKNN